MNRVKVLLCSGTSVTVRSSWIFFVFERKSGGTKDAEHLKNARPCEADRSNNCQVCMSAGIDSVQHLGKKNLFYVNCKSPHMDHNSNNMQMCKLFHLSNFT